MPSVAVGVAAVQLAAFEVGTSLILKAAPANAGAIHFGYTSAVTAGGTAATDGIPLSAGQSIELAPKRCGTTSLAGLPIASSSAVFVIATQAAQTLYFDAR